MSRDTHLCDRCKSIFSTGPDLPATLGPETRIVVSSSTDPQRQRKDEENGHMWIEACGMLHRRHWKADGVTKETLVQSAEENCYICTRIWTKYSTFTNEGVRYPPRVKSMDYEIIYHGGDTFLLAITVYGAQESCVGLLCGIPRTVFNFRGVLKTGFYSEPIQQSLAPTTHSQQTMDQARTWIDHCTKHHIKCEEYFRTHEPLLSPPKRLICVESLASEHGISAYLCQGDIIPRDAKYLTLSHRWGEYTYPRLLKENINRWQNGLPLEELSATFRDALYMAYSMGFNFIWIDSLCIIQDDLRDWQTEAEAMCRIYKGAVCNIAASARQTNKGHGFLPSPRDGPPLIPPSVHVDWHNSPFSNGDNLHGRDFVITESCPVDELNEDELYSRAWLLQEQLLAPRTLHCQGDQIFWECRSSICNEVWPSGWVKSLGGNRGRIQSQVSPFRLNHKELNLQEENIQYITWLEMVMHYSRRGITYPTDRLPALAGIADDTSLLAGAYASGIWQNALHNGILYRSRGHLQSLEEPPALQPSWHKVPSWSWASLNQPVVFATIRHPPDTVKLCKIEFTASQDQPNTLKITGPLIRLDWVKSSQDAVECQAFWKPAWDDPIFHRIARYGGGATWEVHVQEDHWFAQKCFKEFFDHLLPKKDYGDAPEQPYFDGLFDNILFMPVLFEEGGMPKTIGTFSQISPYSRIIGLILWSERNDKRGTFRRVGTARLKARKTGISTLDLFNMELGAYQANLQEKDFIQTDGKGSYTIVVE